MQLESCLEAVGATDKREEIGEHWEDSMACLPTGPLPYLEPANIKEWREFCSMSPDVDEILIGAAEKLNSDPVLKAFAWHLYRRLYVHTEGGNFSEWPGLDKHIPEAPDAIYLLACLAAVPGTIETHRKLGVDTSVTRDTMLEVKCFAWNYADAYEGRVGIIKSQLFWLRHYPAGRLFRVGRFEYMVRPFGGRIRAYRNRETGAVIALTEAGVTFDKDGFIPIEGFTTADAGFTSELSERAGAIRGNPIDPRGPALREPVELDLSEWEPALTPGDLTLDMHIPSGGGMRPEVCEESLREAFEFFGKTFPDKPVKSVSCFSWIYNPDFPEILGDGANLVKHLKELYLFPIASTGRDGLFFLFYQDSVDPKTARRDTSVRRAILDHLDGGGFLRLSGMFLLKDDLPKYGTEIYRQGRADG